MKLVGPAVAVVFTLALAPGEAGATIPSCLGLKGIVYVLGESEQEGDVFKQKLDKVRFSTRDILELLAMEFPMVNFAGACIQVTPEDDPTPDSVALVDGDGMVLQDLTGFVAVNLDTDAMMFSGSFNDVTLAESSVILFPIEINLTLPMSELDATMNGLAFEKFRAGAMNEDTDLNKVRASIKAKVSGDGTVEAQPAFVEGAAKLAGSGEFDLAP